MPNYLGLPFLATSLRRGRCARGTLRYVLRIKGGSISYIRSYVKAVDCNIVGKVD
jgi:hypothetical protein